MFNTTPEKNPEEENIREENSSSQDTKLGKKNKDSFFGDLIRFSLLSIAIVIPIRLFIASPFVVNGSSMDPTFTTGQYLIVDQLTYKLHDPERGDIVIFHYPKDPSKFFIKRIIGLPNETVTLLGKTARIINDEYPEGFTLDESFLTHTSKDDDYSITLGPDEYLVLGDNRTASSDSRIWGPLPRKLIVGRALLRLFPLNSIGVLPGEISPEMLQA